jgi:hypothetical protein
MSSSQMKPLILNVRILRHREWLVERGVMVGSPGRNGHLTRQPNA